MIENSPALYYTFWITWLIVIVLILRKTTIDIRIVNLREEEKDTTDNE